MQPLRLDITEPESDPVVLDLFDRRTSVETAPLLELVAARAERDEAQSVPVIIYYGAAVGG